MYLTNRNMRFIHIYNGKSVTKVYYDRPGFIYNIYYNRFSKLLINCSAISSQGMFCLLTIDFVNKSTFVYSHKKP